MNHHHHHHPQIPSKNAEQDSSGYPKMSLPVLRCCISDPYNTPSASTNNENSVPASRCGGSLPMTLPYSPDGHDFPKSPSHSPARDLPPLPPPHTLRRSVSDLNHSPAKTSSLSSTSSQEYHFPTDLDTPDSKGLMNHRQIKESTSNNNYLPASSLPTTPDRYHFAKSPSHPPARVPPPFSPPHHFPTDLDTPNSKPALVETARAPAVVPAADPAADPTIILALMAFFMTLSLDPKGLVAKKLTLLWNGAEICSAIVIGLGMELTFYILLNWVATQRYPILLWVALLIGKAIFWMSHYGNLPLMVYLPLAVVMNTFLFASLAAKVTLNVGWGVAVEFLLDNLGILKPRCVEKKEE